jgi:hypothetical protein
MSSGISTPALHASGGGLQKYDIVANNNNTTIVEDEKYQSKLCHHLIIKDDIVSYNGDQVR